MTIKEHPMSVDGLDERTRRAVAELRDTIAARYPSTVFELARRPDAPDGLHLLAIADIDDPGEVGDLVVERVVELQAEEGIPLHVIPLRAPERVQAALEAARARPALRPARSGRLLGGAA